MSDQVIKDHVLRKRILAEMHARPYTPITAPRCILRQAFLCDQMGDARSAHDKFADWCAKQNIKPPAENARHHSVTFENTRLTWERHTEFISLTWDCPQKRGAHTRLWTLAKLHTKDILIHSPSLISASKLDLVLKDKSGHFDICEFETESLCMSSLEGGNAIIMTDFRQDLYGSTKYAIQNNGLDDAACGVLVRRLLEIETYRSLALLGFESVKTIMPKIAKIESQLVELTEHIGDKIDLETTRATLEKITDIAGELASLSASSQYRLSATRAYYDLINGRIERINEAPMVGYSKIEEFLGKRLAPAMRTCVNVENRINAAGIKLSGVSNLLRTKVDIQMQAQNHLLLDTMNTRALLQYRLQKTVEGLSIAAVSYYIVGLIAYMIKGFGVNIPISTAKLTALSVPFTLLIVWLVIRKIHKKHE